MVETGLLEHLVIAVMSGALVVLGYLVGDLRRRVDELEAKKK
jgi:hypothetical protein